MHVYRRPSSQPKRPPCRHCGQLRTNMRPRGLCWTCYYLPGVRAQYKPVSKYASRGEGNHNASDLPLGIPTPHMPGTPGKIAILTARAAAGQSLWHPLDAKDRD